MSDSPTTRLVLLGTAGGPLPSPRREGISQAVVVGDRVSVIDCGSGVTRQLRRARLLSSLHQVFITHLHSDHVCDYFNRDTAPSANLIKLAWGADILVHEVFTDSPADLFPDDEDDWEARRRQHHLLSSHTPLSRVGSVAAEAGVRRLVLTHFIPGDDDVADERWIKGASTDFDGEVIVGRDLLELRL